jgi:hypothetical protein
MTMPPKTIKEETEGKTRLRLVDTGKHFVGLAIVNGATVLTVEDETADGAWQRLHNELGRANPKYIGFAGAQNRFLHFFPNGFHSQGYDNDERGYKVAAKLKLEEMVPLAGAAAGSGFGEAVLSVFRATNLLSPFEKSRLQDVLRGPSADSFIRGAARFTLGDTKVALLDMRQALKPHDAAKWTVVTYLPFLWRPEAHMFLKPEVTKDFAARVGHRFASDYESGLQIDVYESLLDLVSETEGELAELEPRDRIDVQSFIWVVGSYKEGKDQPQP